MFKLSGSENAQPTNLSISFPNKVEHIMNKIVPNLHRLLNLVVI